MSDIRVLLVMLFSASLSPVFSQDTNDVVVYTDEKGEAPILDQHLSNIVEVYVYSYKNSLSMEPKDISVTARYGPVEALGNNRYRISPARGTLIRTVYYKGRLIEEGIFVIHHPFEPHIVVRAAQDGRLIDINNGVKNAFKFKISAETGEHIHVPTNNSYRVEAAEIILVRGTQELAKTTVANELADTTPWASLLKPGDRILIHVSSVVRIVGKKEKTTAAGTVITLPVM
jgi:hypothetical protein